ncbi:hypothetical protein PGH07_06675 [Sulfurovum sp. zt1-1]|uniref:NrfJ n=1 Tax=Sulfurovum zhangzhouensis TaxID=3019067 RepID=A0ABT7QYF1_9BACT|nr:hypothetical protein [Sulfurovum zhangzhouensis]MDM5271856.1 hypothetical protein [Sulfurovum zhangzhouensis]
MKRILLVLAMVASLSIAEDMLDKKAGISYAKVLEVIDVMGYDYVKVDENGSERWIAIAKAPVKVGDMIGYDTRTVMKDFQSKQLNRVFDEIVFANEVYLAQKPEKFVSLKAAVMQKPVEEKVELIDVDFVEKPFYTVEDLHKFRKHLEGKTVSLKATVYKVSHDIMKRDWVHLGDGTGSEEALTDDIVFTASHTELKAGDHVVAHGKIVTDKDFGFGYFYPVLGEEASFELNNK